jgi:hypothetical protein
VCFVGERNVVGWVVFVLNYFNFERLCVLDLDKQIENTIFTAFHELIDQFIGGIFRLLFSIIDYLIGKNRKVVYAYVKCVLF